ncbi:hypothetical protein [Yoonia sp. SDW83-1]|uniref:hypothetical protein n=1 Tax=Yoonia sp. SDW83-1 TaxID=3366945 RepID=UPI00398C29F1
MKKTIIGLVAGLAVAGAATWASLQFTSPPSQVDAYNAEEAFYADLEPLHDRMRAVENQDVKEHLFAANFAYVTTRKLLLDRAYPPVGVSYDPHDMATIGHYADPNSFAENYIDSLRAIWEDSLDPKEINLKKPLRYRFGDVVRWESVELSDGRTLTVQPQNAPHENVLMARANQYDGVDILGRDKAGSAIPLRANLQVALKVPSDLRVLSFPAPRIGATQTYDDYRVTITDITPQYAEVTVNRTDGGQVKGGMLTVDLGARDGNGHPIVTIKQTSNDVADIDAFRTAIEDIIALDDTPDAAQQAERLLDGGPALITRSSFQGQIGTLDVYLADFRLARTLTRDLVLPVFVPNAEIADLPDLSQPSEIIDQQLMYLADNTPDLWDAGEVQNVLSVWQDRDAVRYILPPRVSDVFMGEFGRMERSGDMDFGRANRDIAHDDWQIYEVGSTSIRFEPDAFPQPPERVTGKVAVNILTALSRETFTLDQLPAGISVTGNRVTVDGALLRSLVGDQDWARISRRDQDSTIVVFALNAEGLPLQRFHVAGRTNGGSDQVSYYYHGNPSSVLVLRRGPIEQVNVRINHPLDVAAFDLEY